MMPVLDWQREIVQRTLEGAGDYPGVQLQFLLQRLEAHPEALPAIAGALEDMGRWYQSQAAGLDAVVRVREIAKQTTDPKK